MGSQTVEILRQGVWASLTGGWFYDPHQNVFCNAVHLYLWLFLLCTPFVTYLYFPKTITTWLLYCLSTGMTITALKLVNLALHSMYDRAQIISDNNLKKSTKTLREISGTEEAGIELQILGGASNSNPILGASRENNNSNDISQANSAVSIDYPEQVASTIDLKVDVHRKNSSESSESISGQCPKNTAQTSTVTTHNAVVCQTVNYRQTLKTKSKSEDASTLKRKTLSDEGDFCVKSDEIKDTFGDGESNSRCDHKRRVRTRLQRQISLDSEPVGIGLSFASEPMVRSKLQRHRSTDSNDHRRRQRYYHPGHLQSLAPELMYMEPNFTTKSELTIENFPNDTTSKMYMIQKKTPMRKDSTSTMSALQLPTSASSSSSRLRRHSNTQARQSQSSSIVSVRRIKSTALETCCPQPSISNLSPHPYSVETIGGRQLRNPQSAVLPPPSKSLVRNPYLNLFPKGSVNSANSISDPVYPIAELADERSLNDGFVLDSESDSDDNDDDGGEDELSEHTRRKCAFCANLEKMCMHQDDEEGQNRVEDDEDIYVDMTQAMKNTECDATLRQRKSTTSDSDNDRPITQSTDSDTENNGSRSPLLEMKKRPIIVSTGSQAKSTDCDNSMRDSEGAGQRQGERMQLPLPSPDDDDLGPGAVGGVSPNAPNAPNTKSEDSGCPSSDCDQASASSKDMLLSRDPKVPATDPRWHEFNVGVQKIHVDVIDPGEGPSKSTAKTEEVKETRNLGAIPKTTYYRYNNIEENDEIMNKGQRMDKPLSQASSTNSFSGSSYDQLDHHRPSQTLEILQQTKDGWILQTASSNNPYLVAQRGELPSMVPINTRLNRKSYLSLHQPYRQYQPKLRTSTRGRRQNASIDTAGSSRDEDNISTTAAAGGSGSVGTGGSGWDFENIEIQDSFNALLINDGLMLEDPYSFKQAVPPDHSSQPMQRQSMNRMGFGGSMFWGHYNLPPEKQIQPKRYYKFPFKCCGTHEIKISMDRLQLLALFDRDFGWGQTLLAIILAIMVSILGAVVLRLNFYNDIFAFIFSFVIAGSQFSLLKSVQPDAASPIHGFNKAVAYSRPIYFCLCASLLILAHQMVLPATQEVPLPVTLFGISFLPLEFFHIIEEMMALLLLLFPILFSFGLFPQINTFLIYLLEQIDMHIFGGSAVCSLTSAILSVVRSILACCVVYGFAIGGLSEPRNTQHVLFSCFCALLVATSYHLSRSASDFTYLWALIKSSFALNAEDEDEDDELKASRKLQKDSEPSTPVKNAADVASSTSNVASTAAATLSVDKDREDTHSGTVDDTAPNAMNSKETMSSLNQTDQFEVAKQNELEDPLPQKLKATVQSRLKNDSLVCVVIAALMFSLHSSTVFTVLQPELNPVLRAFVIVLGFLLHYVIPQMRKYFPWLCLAKPILKQNEYGMFETRDAAKVMWFESMYVCLCFLERNVLYPLTFVSALTSDSMVVVQKFGIPLGACIIVVCGLKAIRSSYSDPASQYLILIFAVLFFRLDYSAASETFLIDCFFVAIIYRKICELLLKLQFVVTYIAPWQITWGSAFHAFAQPFSVPHSAMLFLQAAISAILSTPLNPFLGSAIFLTSYVRPIKFWERDYNTRRIDHSNTRLSSQLERNLGADDNNLNSIFYEHLTRSLQHSLCGDLLMGRWGNVSQGDCFVLASDYLNCLVHIIELGNGLCTFQMRGLEFRGTYCQQREVEAISEDLEENDGCCCCSPGPLPNMLSVNAMFSTRWLAWQVVASQYVLEGYSISDNLAQATLQVFEFRKVLITYYVKSIIYYTIRSPKLQSWLSSPAIQEALDPTLDRQFVDLDPIFNHNLDEDFDFRASGITRFSFCSVYMSWIQFCYAKRQQQNEPNDVAADAATDASADASKGTSPRSSTNPTPSPRNKKTSKKKAGQNTEEESDEINIKSPLISLLLSLGLLARRTLATATHTHSSLSGVEFFLHGLHALFKGDFRITSPRDEWVFADMDLLHSVVAPAVKMSLKLHQDHFLSPDEYDNSAALYAAIETHTRELVISHEADPVWRNAVLRGAPHLLALRHVMEDGSDEYRLIRLTKRFLNFRVIKLNRECVRGLWAGQQQELIYLRNRNPERGSIQNAKQALRNIINSSCDQPIGYPIYVSPLTTSYAETNDQLCKIIGGAITPEKIRNMAWKFCQRVRQRCREGCSSGSATLDTEMGDIQGVYYNAPTPNNTLSGTTGNLSYGSQSLSGAGNRGSMASMGKPTSSTLLAGFLSREREQERESTSDRTAFRKRGSMASSKAERERRATFPVASSSNPDTLNVKDVMGSTGSGIKQQASPESCGLAIISSGTSSQRPNNSHSSGNLRSRNQPSRTLMISADRKSKSEERQSSRDQDNDESNMIPLNVLQTPTISVQIATPPRIQPNRKVIIVDAGEIYDYLDMGRRINVVWPSEHMRLNGGRSSWKEWLPQEGMVGYVVHYWQPNHPDSIFRSNFNRTLYLIQVGDRFVPVGENGVKEYNTVGGDERIRIVHIPKDELRLNDTDTELAEDQTEESEDSSWKTSSNAEERGIYL